ncbi:hypothetical protein QCE73_26795 [Caballeronia sp. LZ029]|nr:hypothetical protein [Caballeronia sp. LZ029]
MKRTMVLSALGICCACVSGLASAYSDVNVFLGVPGPVYVAPPPVVYQPAPVVYAPAPAYGYGYQREYRDEHRRHDNGKHKGWYKHHGDDDEQ